MFILKVIEQKLTRMLVENDQKKIDSKIDLSDLYRDGFILAKNYGNDLFNKTAENLWVSAIKDGSILKNSLTHGKKNVFADGMKMYCGLENFIFGKTKVSDLPIFVCDNHNFVIEAWRKCPKRTSLIHIDQHFDNAKILGNETDVKDLKVCNYIDFAIKNELVSEDYLRFVESSDLINLNKIKKFKNHIVNLDLDFFAPENSIITLERKIQIIVESCKNAALLTVATSPGFIEQKFAIELAKIFWAKL